MKLDLTQSVHAGVSIGMRRVVKLGISRVSLMGLGARLGWGADGEFLRNPNCFVQLTTKCKHHNHIDNLLQKRASGTDIIFKW